MAKKKADDGAVAVADAAPVVAERESSHGSASPDLLARLKALEAENSRLRAGGAEEAKEVQEYPRAMYRKVPVSVKHANGYEVKRVDSPEAEAALGKAWVKSPADLEL